MHAAHFAGGHDLSQEGILQNGIWREPLVGCGLPNGIAALLIEKDDSGAYTVKRPLLAPREKLWYHSCKEFAKRLPRGKKRLMRGDLAGGCGCQSGKGLVLMHRHSGQMSDSFLTGALLAVSGGFLDAYTYLVRGGVFANAVTGNMVLFGLSAAHCEWSAAARYLAPIIAYGAGVCLTEVVRRRLAHAKYHWRQYILGAEMLIVGAAAFLPAGRWNVVVNTAVAFVCAMQVEAFRKLDGELAYATTMCTGNLRSGSELLFHAIDDHDKGALEKSLRYFAIVAIFIAGAAICFPMTKLLGEKSVLLSELPWLAVMLLMSKKPVKM